MQITHLIRTVAAALAIAAIVAQAALAGGEPKNEWPFTRSLPRTTLTATGSGNADPVIQGEPKNEPPFTRSVVVISSDGDGFNWRDGAMGGLCGAGIALVGAGALLTARRSPRTA